MLRTIFSFSVSFTIVFIVWMIGSNISFENYIVCDIHNHSFEKVLPILLYIFVSKKHTLLNLNFNFIRFNNIDYRSMLGMLTNVKMSTVVVNKKTKNTIRYVRQLKIGSVLSLNYYSYLEPIIKFEEVKTINQNDICVVFKDDKIYINDIYIGNEPKSIIVFYDLILNSSFPIKIIIENTIYSLKK